LRVLKKVTREKTNN